MTSNRDWSVDDNADRPVVDDGDLYEAVTRAAWQIAPRYGLHGADALDVAHDVWMKLARNNRLVRIEHLPAYLSRAIRNEAIERLRKSTRRPAEIPATPALDLIENYPQLQAESPNQLDAGDLAVETAEIARLLRTFLRPLLDKSDLTMLAELIDGAAVDTEFGYESKRSTRSMALRRLRERCAEALVDGYLIDRHRRSPNCLDLGEILSTTGDKNPALLRKRVSRHRRDCRECMAEVREIGHNEPWLSRLTPEPDRSRLQSPVGDVLPIRASWRSMGFEVQVSPATTVVGLPSVVRVLVTNTARRLAKPLHLELVVGSKSLRFDVPAILADLTYEQQFHLPTDTPGTLTVGPLRAGSHVVMDFAIKVEVLPAKTPGVSSPTAARPEK